MNPACPPEPTLHEFLGGALSGPREEAVAAHVEECADCQARLDRLSVGPLPTPDGSLSPGERGSVESFLNQVKSLGAPDPSTNPNRERPSPVPPPVIPDYQFLAEIGRGGMGVVYKAIHLPLNRVVAVKMILSGETERHQFRAEAEAIARLQHPNIVQVFEVGEADGRPYLALEYVPGGTLQQRIGDRPQEPCPAARLIEVLARAVHAAHAQKLIHRDIKPGNVLLAPSLAPADDAEREYGVPKLTDFGLAKRLDADHPSLSRAVTGTPGYMAPEQVPDAAAPGTATAPLGPAVDVWALGVILYQLLTGRPPFLAPDWMTTLLQVVRRDPVPARQFQPGVPRDLDTICLKCLNKDPRKRYASAADLADDLQRFLANKPIRARPVGAVERGLKWAGRHPVASSAVAAAAVGLLAALTGLGFALHSAEARRAAEAAAVEGLRERERLANQSREREERLRTDAERSLSLSKITQANLLWRDADAARARQTLAQCPPAFRRWEWEYLNRICHDGLAVKDLAVGYRADAVGVGPGWFAAAGTAPAAPGAEAADPLVYLWDDDGRLRLRGVAPSKLPPVALSVTPSGRRLLLIQAGPDEKSPPGLLVAWDVPPARSGSDQPRPPAFTLPLGRAWGLSADGRVLAADSEPEGGVLLHDVEANVRIGVVPIRGRAFAVAENGSRVAVCAGSRVHVWSTDPLRELARWDEPEADALALDGEGRRLAYFAPRRDAVVVREADDAEAAALAVLPFDREFRRSRVRLTFTPDGRSLIAPAADGVRVWGIESRGQTTLAGHQGKVLAMATSPDGRLIATAGEDATARLWTVAGRRPSGPSQGVYRGHAGPVRVVAFGSDGRRLVTGGADGTVRVWDLTRGQEALPLPGDARGVWFAADGSLLTLGRDQAIWWDAAAGTPDSSFPVARAESDTRFAHEVAFASAAKRLVVIAPGRDRVQILDAAGKLVHELHGHKFPITSVAASEDGRVVVTGSAGLVPGGLRPRPVGEVCVWDGESGAMTQRLEDSGLCVCALAVTPDGAMAAVATGWPAWDRTAEPAPAATLRLMPTAAGRLCPPFAGDPLGSDPFVLLAFHPGGGVLAAVPHKRRGTVMAFGLPEWKVAWEAKAPGAFVGLAFHPDGDRLAAVTDPAGVTVYDVISGAEALRLGGLTGGQDLPAMNRPTAGRVGFGLDGRELAAVFRGGVLVWEGSTNPDADRAAWRRAAERRSPPAPALRPGGRP